MARVLCTIFCRQTLENRDWRRGHEAMSQQIPQVDQAMLETTLDRMVRKTVEEMLNAMLDAEVDCFASMFVRQVRQCFSVVWADGFPRCRHRFPVM